MIITAIRDAINDHVTHVSAGHRLRFAAMMPGETAMTFQCICDFAGDRSSWNDHIDEMYRVAAIEPPPANRGRVHAPSR